MSKSLPRRLVELIVNPYRIEDMAIYRFYLMLCRPNYYRMKQLEREFYRGLIRDVGQGLVFDIGANGGAKAVIFAAVADKVLCVEPSPGSVRFLQERFANTSTVSIVAKGAGSKPGSIPFHIFGETDYYNTFSSKWSDHLGSLENTSAQPVKKVEQVITVAVTTLDELIDRFGLPSYIKIDVEGFEFEVLKGLSRPVNLISIECNLPEFKSETLECLLRLQQIEPEARFNFCTSEPPTKLASDYWISRSEMEQIVEGGQYSYMEIYCKPAMPTGIA